MLRNLHSWKVLDLEDSTILQNDATEGTSQLWKFISTDGGYQIVNYNGTYLDGSSENVSVSSEADSEGLLWNLQLADPGTALDFTVDGTQYIGIHTFEVSEGNVTELSGYYHIDPDVDLPGADYDLSGGSNYSIGLKVMYVNSFLADAGYLRFGYYGYNRYDGYTTYAVSVFQQEQGLTANGIVDLETWLAMGYSENDFNHLGDYITELKVESYGSSRDAYINAMVTTAWEYAQAGTRFSDGASGAPGTFVDCSGLIFQCLYAAGINPDVNIIDHARVVYEYTSAYLAGDWKLGAAVGSAAVGDLIFYGRSSVNHVAIYVGNGMVYDSQPGGGVALRNVYSGGNILKIVRIF